MGFTFGFYNSMNHDRRYNAEQVSKIFDGLITDGIYASIGDKLFTVPGEGLQVIVKSGRAWFNHTWNDNSTPLAINLQPADPARPRYDAVVLEVQGGSIRKNIIKIIKGDPETTPIKPTLINTDVIHQNILAYVLVEAGATSLDATKIDIRVGHSDCPFVTSIVETTNIDDLFMGWEVEFDKWFDNIKATLSDDVVTNLQRQIDALPHCHSGPGIPDNILGNDGDFYVKIT